MDHELLSKQIEQYFENGMTSVYMKHSISEVDFYKWLPTNEFVYKKYNTNTFKLWKGTADLLMETLFSETLSKKTDKEIVDILKQEYALPKVK